MITAPKPMSVSVGVVVLALCASGVGFKPWPYHHASVWDVLTTTSVRSSLQTKEVKMVTGSITHKIAA